MQSGQYLFCANSLSDCKIPYILILGGTDVNEFSKDEQRMAVMTVAVTRAR